MSCYLLSLWDLLPSVGAFSGHSGFNKLEKVSLAVSAYCRQSIECDLHRGPPRRSCPRSRKTRDYICLPMSVGFKPKEAKKVHLRSTPALGLRVTLPTCLPVAQTFLMVGELGLEWRGLPQSSQAHPQEAGSQGSTPRE